MADTIEYDPSLWVERLWLVAVPWGNPRYEDSKKAAARCPYRGTLPPRRALAGCERAKL